MSRTVLFSRELSSGNRARRPAARLAGRTDDRRAGNALPQTAPRDTRLPICLSFRSVPLSSQPRTLHG